MPAVCGIAKRTEVCVVGRDQINGPAPARYAMELFDRTNHIFHVFDQVNSAHLIERVIAEGQRTLIHIAENVGCGVGVHINPDRTRILPRPAADIQNTQTPSAKNCLTASAPPQLCIRRARGQHIPPVLRQ